MSFVTVSITPRGNPVALKKTNGHQLSEVLELKAELNPLMFIPVPKTPV
jgi:hypothetical protein